MNTRPISVEWPTYVLICVTYAVWLVSIFWVVQVSVSGAIVLTALAIAQHSSLQHEVIHEHPSRNQLWNETLVFPNLGLLIPYIRFRDTHLAHHLDSNLTDPYDDPESNYIYPEDWQELPIYLRLLHRFNNLLVGRLIVGPLIGQVAFMRSDIRAVLDGDRSVLMAWIWHIPAVVLVCAAIALSNMPLWAYAIAAYAAQSILKIRTFLEHQAHEKSRARTVVIEDNGPLSILFLNNNFHIVHHLHPKVPWYELPALYRSNAQRYLALNEDYRFPSYFSIFRAFLFKAKDTVVHPIWYRKP